MKMKISLRVKSGGTTRQRGRDVTHGPLREWGGGSASASASACINTQAYLCTLQPTGFTQLAKCTKNVGPAAGGRSSSTLRDECVRSRNLCTSHTLHSLSPVGDPVSSSLPCWPQHCPWRSMRFRMPAPPRSSRVRCLRRHPPPTTAAARRAPARGLDARLPTTDATCRCDMSKRQASQRSSAGRAPTPHIPTSMHPCMDASLRAWRRHPSWRRGSRRT